MTSAPRTFAVIVGVGEYSKESTWRLPGAATDAARVAVWLLRRGVPASNVLLFLSPKPPSARKFLESVVGEAVPQAEGCTAEDATEPTILNVLRTRLRDARGDVLFMFWAGHGLADRQRVRRLLFADAAASDRLNLPVETLLDSLRSDQYTGFAKQIFCFDACATLFDERTARQTLPTAGLTVGEEQTWREQMVLYASSYGEDAVEQGAGGVFTTALLEGLDADDAATWPPDMPAVMQRLSAQFTDPLAGQRPTMWRFFGPNQDYASQDGATVQSRAKPRIESVRRVDRDPQTRAFGRFFCTTAIQAHRNRPHAVILFGNERERHHSLVERVVADQVEEIARAALEIKAKPPTRSLPWPGDGEDVDELREELLRAMFTAAAAVADKQNFGPTPPAPDDAVNDRSAQTLLRRLQVTDRPLVVLHHTSVVSRWNRAQSELLRWYMDVFWDPPAGAVPGPHVLLFLKFVCDPTLSRPTVGSLLKRYLSPKRQMCEDLRRIAATRDVGCRRTVLNELLPVPYSALKRWFFDEAIDRWMTEQDALDAATRIFTAAGRRVDELPMAVVEQALTALIDPQRKAS